MYPLLLYELLWGLLLLVPRASPCTLIVVGNKATEDGSAIVVHTDDAGAAPEQG